MTLRHTFLGGQAHDAQDFCSFSSLLAPLYPKSPVASCIWQFTGAGSLE